MAALVRVPHFHARAGCHFSRQETGTGRASSRKDTRDGLVRQGDVGRNAKNGRRAKDWSVIKFADETGEMEACAFSKCHAAVSGWIGDAAGIPILMEGSVSCNHVDGEEASRIRFTLDAITPLNGHAPLDGELAVEMAYGDEQLVEKTAALRQILHKHPGLTPVSIPQGSSFPVRIRSLS